MARQILFTIADITSKLIFGVVLARCARLRSADDGYEPAVAAERVLPQHAPRRFGEPAPEPLQR